MLLIAHIGRWEDSPAPSESILINSFEEDEEGDGFKGETVFDHYGITPRTPESNLADERPLPALIAARQQNSNNAGSELNHDQEEFAPASPCVDAHVGQPPNDESAPLDVLSEASLREAAIAIEVVGPALVSLLVNNFSFFFIAKPQIKRANARVVNKIAQHFSR